MKMVIKITIEVDEKKDVKAKVDVKVKGEQFNSIAADTKLTKSDTDNALDTLLMTNVKLRQFKATEADI
jgi:hypothetical protein